MNSSNRTRLAGFACAILCEVIFGFSFYFTKRTLVNYAFIDLLAWRFNFAVAALLLLKFSGIAHWKIASKELLPLIGLGLLFPGGYFIGEACGISRITSCEVGIIISAAPAITLLFSFWILKERPARRQTAGIALSIAGVIVCVLAKGWSVSFNVTGYFLVFAALTFYCLYLVLAKKLTQTSALGKTFVISAVGAVVYDLIAMAYHLHTGDNYLILPFVHKDFRMSVVYLGVMCSGVAIYLCNRAIETIGGSSFSSFIGIETLVAIFTGILLLGEAFTGLQAIGTVCVLSGVYLANHR